MWGSFSIGSYKGVLLLDPGPKAKSSNVPFEWRGTSAGAPDVLFMGPLCVGEVRFEDPGTIQGYFDVMHGKCEFSGNPYGPRVCPEHLQELVDRWNDYGSGLMPDEHLGAAKSVATSADTPETPPGKESQEQNENGAETEPQTDDFLKKWKLQLNGVYDVACSDIEGNRTGNAPDQIRLLVDQQVCWGMFDIGIYTGYLRLDTEVSDIQPGKHLRFQWRGQETDFRLKKDNDDGAITTNDRFEVNGYFKGMVGERLVFRGRRKPGPCSSGHETNLYRYGYKNFFNN
ncbi:uncharacterized protein DFL_008006 [Arthrobotrys flagrans]|uniref:Uncharacterized protein n=1 Tax=Arthrobotrys flagrans TaxID=97331 RepID=A0A436ZXC1_ARTFL|nr:hypothetical protein DFL_008006 [Arthrobotrys flagrans]